MYIGSMQCISFTPRNNNALLCTYNFIFTLTSKDRYLYRHSKQIQRFCNSFKIISWD